jgi:predicted DNA-binding ribbon-helix-helix protein
MTVRPLGKSLVKRRTVDSETRKTSVTIEAAFWESLKQIAAKEKLTLGELIARLDRDRQHANLSSAIRLYVLEHYRRLASEGAPGGSKPSADAQVSPRASG